MENEFKAALKWDAGEWCVIRYAGYRFYLGWKNQKAFRVDDSGEYPIAMAIGSLPEEVQKEFMLWRLSK